MVAVQILFVQIHGGDPAVVIGCVIVDSPTGIAAGGILGDLKSALLVKRTAALLAHGAEYVEKLADGGVFGII